MSTASPSQPSPPETFDPDSYRMSIGDHLEELRWRLILGLIGFALALAGCLIFGTRVVQIFCSPLYTALQANDLNPQLYYNEIGDTFMVYMQVSVIVAVSLASPWILYQLWQFVAAGLYPQERKYATRYAPLSIGLLIAGMLFVYFLVLPWTIAFFLDFAGGIPIPQSSRTTAMEHTAVQVPVLPGDPAYPKDNEIWIDGTEGRVKLFYRASPSDPGQIRVIPFSPSQLLAPQITLPNYIDMVLGMLLVFGLSFQLPLIVLALVRLGILEVEALKKARKYVYFAMAILAAAITPGDVITATVALMVPLCLLYELGLVLARRGNKTAAGAA